MTRERADVVSRSRFALSTAVVAHGVASYCCGRAAAFRGGGGAGIVGGMSNELRAEVGLFLGTSRTAALATVDERGQPHAANVQYCTDEALRMYWVSSPDAEHSRHVARTGRAAVAVYAHDDRVEQIHGVQLHGSVEAVEGEAEWNRVFELYTAKFAFLQAMPQLRREIERQRFYALTPTWLRWIDNRRGFGFKAEVEVGG